MRGSAGRGGTGRDGGDRGDGDSVGNGSASGNGSSSGGRGGASSGNGGRGGNGRGGLDASGMDLGYSSVDPGDDRFSGGGDRSGKGYSIGGDQQGSDESLGFESSRRAERPTNFQMRNEVETYGALMSGDRSLLGYHGPGLSPSQRSETTFGQALDTFGKSNDNFLGSLAQAAVAMADPTGLANATMNNAKEESARETLGMERSTGQFIGDTAIDAATDVVSGKVGGLLGRAAGQIGTRVAGKNVGVMAGLAGYKLGQQAVNMVSDDMQFSSDHSQAPGVSKPGGGAGLLASARATTPASKTTPPTSAAITPTRSINYNSHNDQFWGFRTALDAFS